MSTYRASRIPDSANMSEIRNIRQSRSRRYDATKDKHAHVKTQFHQGGIVCKEDISVAVGGGLAKRENAIGRTI